MSEALLSQYHSSPPLSYYRSLGSHPKRVTGGLRPRSASDKPLVSVLTICRNAAGTIAKCIASVSAQTYSNIEYLVCDGNSTDGTLDVLRAHDSEITCWFSEPDKGRVDGISKLLGMARGDYIVFVMADDWLSPEFVQIGVDALTNTGLDYAHGDCVLWNSETERRYRRSGTHDFERRLMWSFSLVSPSFVVSRKFIETIGVFQPPDVANDYEWFLRAHHAGLRGIYVPDLVMNFRVGGLSSSGAPYQGFREVAALALKFGGPRFKIYAHYTEESVRYFTMSMLARVLPEKMVRAIRLLRHRA